jgi:hypothetical protein
MRADRGRQRLAPGVDDGEGVDQRIVFQRKGDLEAKRERVDGARRASSCSTSRQDDTVRFSQAKRWSRAKPCCVSR